MVKAEWGVSRQVMLLLQRKQCREHGRLGALHMGEQGGRTDPGPEKGMGPGLCIPHAGTLSGLQLRSDRLRADVSEDNTAAVAFQWDGCRALSCGVSAANPLECHGEFCSSSHESQDVVKTCRDANPGSHAHPVVMQHMPWNRFWDKTFSWAPRSSCFYVRFSKEIGQ